MIQPGTKLAHYEILSSVGKGGMGEVWRARDTKLGREVAIKTLPSEFATDNDRLARFEREAKLLASLNHPNIAAIHGIEEHDTCRFLVLELVEGTTLADRIERGAIPIEESLKFAAEIAEALDAAHEKGVVHRDLKPANIKVTPDGKVKVLDFGLAKASTDDHADSNLSNSPTLSLEATKAGVILGTAAYMSPEQAKGQPTDKRTDIWSFGCVLYEMLAGRPTWSGATAMDMIAGAVARDPDFSVLPEDLPGRIRELLERCLEKNPQERFRDIGDVRIELKRVSTDLEEGVSDRVVPDAPAPARSRLGWTAALVLALVLAAGGAWALFEPPPDPPIVSRFRLDMPPGVELARINGSEVAISPGGERIAFLGVESPPEVQVYVRDLDSLEARLIAGSQVPPLGNGLTPFFSPDGSSIVFRTATALRRQSLAGGPPLTVVDNPRALFNGVWLSDDRILYSDGGNGVFFIAVDGSTPPRRVTPEPEPEVFYVFPSLLPNGQILLSEWRGTPRVESIALLDPDTSQMRTLVEPGTNAVYTSTGHLLFQRASTLMAARFDVDAGEIQAEPVPVVEGVTEGEWAISDNGTLVYVPAPPIPTFSLRWVGRDGQLTGPAVAEAVAGNVNLRISPEGDRVAVANGSVVQPDGDLWIYDLTGRPAIPLLRDVGVTSPVWSPDGTEVAFTSGSPGILPVYILPADGSNPEPRQVETGAEISYATDWSAEDRLIGGSPNGAWIVPVRDGTRPDALAEPETNAGRLSPDGQWLAYTSNRTGTNEVWVRAFSGGSGIRVSPSGGTQPVWSRDSTEIFYQRENAMMVVAWSSENDAFRFDAPEVLFEMPFSSPLTSYDVAPDGRFLMPWPTNTENDSTGEPGIVVVQNWHQELLERVPVD